RSTAGSPGGKAPGYLSQQVRQQRGPGLIGYRGSSDCRVLVVSHKPIMIAAAASLRSPLTCAPHLTVTNYCCRIRGGRRVIQAAMAGTAEAAAATEIAGRGRPGLFG